MKVQSINKVQFFTSTSLTISKKIQFYNSVPTKILEQNNQFKSVNKFTTVALNF